MPAHNRSKNGVASLAYVASIHVSKDGRNGGQAATMLNADCSLPPTSNVVRSGTDGCEVAVVSDGPAMLPARSRFLPGMAVDSRLAVVPGDTPSTRPTLTKHRKQTFTVPGSRSLVWRLSAARPELRDFDKF
jgi:hypothetical protein